jgi:SAM-dependent methyltransferase
MIDRSERREAARPAGASDAQSCPSCGSSDIRCWGPIPPRPFFAGRARQGLNPGSLYECNSCGLGFRHPFPAQAELDALYADAPATHWANELEPRPDWKLARGWVTAAEGARDILDIGCWDGQFLADLPRERRLFGVEGAFEATRVAQERGVEVLASRLEELTAKENRPSFDIVTAFDVIEHVREPRAFIATMVGVLRPGGRIIISTGNFHAREFRMMGRSYWYCVNPEHLSFLSPEWIQSACNSLGLKVVRIERFSHIGHRPVLYAKQAIANCIYKSSPRAFGLIRKIASLRRNIRSESQSAISPPTWMAAPDHFIVELMR